MLKEKRNKKISISSKLVDENNENNENNENTVPFC